MAVVLGREAGGAGCGGILTWAWGSGPKKTALRDSILGLYVVSTDYLVSRVEGTLQQNALLETLSPDGGGGGGGGGW